MTKRGETLELAVLGLLHENPLHGYELRKRLNLVLGWGRVLSYGSLYPTLKKMLRAGLLSEHVATPDSPGTGSPGTGSGPVSPPSRRQRITYELTEAGQARFDQLMADAGPSSWEDEVFGVRFAFFGRTDRDIRLRILEGRRARLEERLSQVRADLDRSQGRDTYARELKRHGVESVERELSWLAELIAAERQTGHPDASASP